MNELATSRERIRSVSKTQRKFVQARGEARRKLLLETAFRLLRTQYLEQITYQDISRESGVPLASCYHFFPGKVELFAELIDYAGPWHKHVMVTALLRPAKSWTDILKHLSDALIRAYESDLAFVQLFSTWKIPGTAYTGREQGFLEAADRILQGIDRQFTRPPFSQEREVFLCATRISEAIWRASITHSGHVSDFARQEAQRAMVSYLSNYVPPILERHEHPRTMPALQLPNTMPDMIRELIAPSS